MGADNIFAKFSRIFSRGGTPTDETWIGAAQYNRDENLGLSQNLLSGTKMNNVFGKSSVRRQSVLPAKNSDCLCGSGEKFKRCCADKLPGWNRGKATYATFNTEDYSKALTMCRADITQYSIWHKTNTAPYLQSAPEAVAYLLNLDIRALAEMAELLERCYVKTGKAQHFPAVLERLRANINHPRWQRKVTYLHAIHALGPDWNEAAGRRELRKLGDMESETDVETLQLYLDLFHDELSFSRRLKLADRVIRLADKAAERLHYRGQKAVELLLVGDTAGAESELADGIASYEADKGKDASSIYARDRLAGALELLGKLRNDPILLDRSIEISRSLIEDDGLTSLGRAAVLRQMGDAYSSKGEWESATDAYRKAFATVPRPVFQVLIAQCLLESEGSAAATDAIRAIAVTELEGAEYADYVFALAAIGIEGKDPSILADGEALLRNLSIREPYFREQRDSLLLGVVDARQSERSAATAEPARRLLRGLTSSLLRYIKLEPNFMGIGLNLGKFLEDVNEGTKLHQGDRTER